MLLIIFGISLRTRGVFAYQDKKDEKDGFKAKIKNTKNTFFRQKGQKGQEIDKKNDRVILPY